ncbi:hypothetical protein HORIV_36090 [Vreelandella olivaria]|uniref:Uncharacterized protein n=1 Tax=Vreelandella olivaria TaxID=390919 RepID=A0ABM7GKF7_9GAMM|nr:hypothetical protein HORIV_36090 [Halomonas olivaria]
MPKPNKPDEAQAEAVEQVPVHVDHLISNGELAAENAWCVSYAEDALPEQRPAFVPLSLWQSNQEDAELAPLLMSDTELNPELAAELSKALAIAVDFPPSPMAVATPSPACCASAMAIAAKCVRWVMC